MAFSKILSCMAETLAGKILGICRGRCAGGWSLGSAFLSVIKTLLRASSKGWVMTHRELRHDNLQIILQSWNTYCLDSIVGKWNDSSTISFLFSFVVARLMSAWCESFHDVSHAFTWPVLLASCNYTTLSNILQDVQNSLISDTPSSDRS